MEKSKPYVILSAAMSIDGKIASHNGRSNLSSKRDLARVHKLRSTVDAILVGKKTIEIDDPLLTVRYVKGRSPIRVVLDSKGNLSQGYKIFKTAKDYPTIIIVSENASNKIKKLGSTGVKVITCGRNKINLKRLLEILAKMGIKRIILEGGGITNWNFIEEKLVDELRITITPYILGGINSISLVEGVGFGRIPPPFKLVKIEKMKNELVLQYVY